MLPPPPATPREEVADEWHGERVADPYRWLEGSSERIAAWTDAQNARTRAVLDAVPERAAFASRLRELLSVGLLSTPRPAGPWIFHTRREGAQKQSVLYARRGLAGDDRARIDPNALDEAGLVTIDWYYPSWDGRFVAYGLSRGGDELSTLYVVETQSGRDTGEKIPHTQRSSVAWVEDGFYYTVHPVPGTVPPGDEHYHRRVKFHRLGDGPSQDELVFGEGRAKEDILGVQTSPDGRWVLLLAFRGWVQSDVYLLERQSGRLRTVVEGEDGLTGGMLTNDTVWLRTNLGAPNYTIARAPVNAPARGNWKTVVHRREASATGDVPTILSGYGGFNISRTPAYFPGVAAWVEAGGLFALPNLRGGGEYGETWHRAGMLEKKQNVFDDFHAAAEALVARGWTRPERLGVTGGSNGGLLTRAALTQRPDLFGAVYCAVPLLDMLRYQNLLIARLWISEYGSAEDPEQYRWLRAYSPYHHVREGIHYPAALFTTAVGDSRVDPMHARKMAALLQAQSAEDPDATVLLRVDHDAGHGIGKPLDKQVDDLADQYSFLAWRLGLDPAASAMLDRR